MSWERTSYRGEFITVEWLNIGPEILESGNDLANKLRNKLEAETRREAEIVQRAFERTTATWQTPVEFYFETNRLGDQFSLTVWTDNEIYGYVNDGTAVRHALLPNGYRTKTQPRVIGSRGGGGSPLKISKSLNLPGIIAREFVDEIADRRMPWYESNMEKVFYEVMEKYFSD